MKTLNVRLIAILLGCIVVGGAALALAHWFQVDRFAGLRLQMAKEAEIRGEKIRVIAERADDRAKMEDARAGYTEAAENYGWYEGLAGKEVDAMEKHGLLMADAPGDHIAWLKARGKLGEVLQEDPDRVYARRELIRLNIIFREFGAAEKDIKRLLDKSPEDADLLLQLGYCQKATDDNTGAIESFEKVIEKAPETIEAYLNLAAMLRDNERAPLDRDRPTCLKQADQCMQKMIAANPISSSAHLAYGEYLRILVFDTSIEDGWQHPILHDTMVSSVISQVAKETVRRLRLAEDDPDAAILKARHDLLAEAVRRSAMKYDASLPWDDPDELFRQLKPRVAAGEIDEAEITRACDEAVKAWSAELEPADQEALAVATKHEVLDASLEGVIGAFGNRAGPVRAAKHQALSRAVTYNVKARSLAIDEERVLAWAAEHKILQDALRRVLGKEKSPGSLRLTAKRDALVSALKDAIQAASFDSSQREKMLEAANKGILLAAMVQALTHRELVTNDLDTLLKSGKDGSLSRVAVRGQLATELHVKNTGSLALDRAARCRIWEGDIDHARQYAEQGIEAFPKKQQMYELLASVESKAGQPEKMLAAWRQGLIATNDHPSLLWSLAEHQIETKVLDDARQTIDRLNATADELSLQEWLGRNYKELKPVMIGYLQAWIEFQQGHWRSAIHGREPTKKQPGTVGFEQIMSGLTARPKLNAKAKYYLGRSYGQLGNPAKEEEALRGALAVDPSLAQAKGRLTTLLLGRDPSASIKHFKEMVLQGQISSAQMIQMADRLIAKNRPLPADQRNWADVFWILKRVPEGTPQHAIAVIRQADVEVIEGRNEEAERMITEARDKTPDEVQFWTVLARFAIKQEDWEKTERIFSEAEQALESSTPLLIARAEYVLQRYKDSDGPDRLMQLANKFQPADDPSLSDDERTLQNERWAAFLAQFSKLAQRHDAWSPADQLLKQAAEIVGDTLTVRLNRASYLVGRLFYEGRKINTELSQRTDLSEQERQETMAADLERLMKLAFGHLRKLAENTDHFTLKERLRLWASLLNVADRFNDNDLAAYLCEQIAAADPNNLGVRRHLFDLARSTGDQVAIQKRLDEIKRIEGEGPNWLYGQAVLAALVAEQTKDEKKLEQALAYVTKAQQLRPTWPEPSVLAAQIHMQRNQQDLALENYLRAVKQGTNNVRALLQTTQLLIRRGRYQEADPLVERLKGMPTQYSAAIVAMERVVAQQVGKLDRALELAEAATENSDQAAVHLEYAKLLVQKIQQPREPDQTAEAIQKTKAEMDKIEAALRRALELSSDVADLAQASEYLIEFLIRASRITEAEAVYAQASDKIKDPRFLARMLMAMRKNSEAQQQYESALKANPEDLAIAYEVTRFYLMTNKLDLAETQLNRFVQGELEAEKATVAWARRAMAEIFRSRGGLKNREKALALIEANLQEGVSTAQDLRLKANLSPGIRRQEAIEALISLIAQGNPTPNDYLALARHYLAMGDWSSARSHLQQAVATSNSHPAYAAQYAQELLEHGELNTAERIVAGLERRFRDKPEQFQQVGTKGFTAVFLRANILSRRGRYQQTLDQLDQFAAQGNALSRDRTNRLYQAASALESFAQELDKPAQEQWREKYIARAGELYGQYVAERPQQKLALVSFFTRQGRITDALNQLDDWKGLSTKGLAAMLMTFLNNSDSASPAELQRVEQLLTSALEHHKRPADLLTTLAELRILQTRYDEAETLYREILKANSQNVIAMNNLAILLAHRKSKLKESRQLIDKAIKVTGPMGAMFDSRATVYLATGQTKQALADMKLAVADKATPVRCFHLALAHHRDGNTAEATKAMQKAVSLGLKPRDLQPLEQPAYALMMKLVN